MFPRLTFHDLIVESKCVEKEEKRDKVSDLEVAKLGET